MRRYDLTLGSLGGSMTNSPILVCLIRKAVNDYRELKLLLDMYKGVGKEQRDKVQLMAAEKKARQEVEELKAQVRIFVADCGRQ